MEINQKKSKFLKVRKDRFVPLSDVEINVKSLSTVKKRKRGKSSKRPISAKYPHADSNGYSSVGQHSFLNRQSAGYALTNPGDGPTVALTEM